MNKYLKKFFVVLSFSAIFSACFAMNVFAEEASTTQENVSAIGYHSIETIRIANKTSVTFSNTSGVPINFTVATNPRYINPKLSVTVNSGRNASVTIPFISKTRAARPHKLYISLYNPNGGKITGTITYNDYR